MRLQCAGFLPAHAAANGIVFSPWIKAHSARLRAITDRGTRNDGSKHHVAFAVSLERLFESIERLQEKGVETLGFGGDKTTEPSVIGWMPSAQIYFRDPDGHMLEFISILPEQARPEFIGIYSEWKLLART